MINTAHKSRAGQESRRENLEKLCCWQNGMMPCNLMALQWIWPGHEKTSFAPMNGTIIRSLKKLDRSVPRLFQPGHQVVRLVERQSFGLGDVGPGWRRAGIRHQCGSRVHA